jgi:hypothetical protein
MSGVTDTRYFSGKMSRSRNDPYGPTPDACHHCRTAFAHGQVRYPVLSGINWGGGWGLASVCMDCFKCAAVGETEGDTTELQRHQHKCEGCGEPMLTVLDARAGQWRVCSPRCYQRVYRKRRHGRDSVVDWKGECRSCAVCKKPVEERRGQPKRKDAVYCSSKCKQWAYRRRHAEV